jgi:hemolysin III
MWLIALGGVIYTAGALIYTIGKPNFHRHFGHHEIWHLFVMAGTACHFVAAALWVAN